MWIEHYPAGYLKDGATYNEVMLVTGEISSRRISQVELEEFLGNRLLDNYLIILRIISGYIKTISSSQVDIKVKIIISIFLSNMLFVRFASVSAYLRNH